MLSFLKKLVIVVLKISVALFIILSILPYCFSFKSKTNDFKTKPFSNSYFIYSNNAFVHFRIFVPEKIKHKIILFHGFSGSTFSFRKNMDSLLAAGALIVAPDMPAFGYSDKRAEANYTDTCFISAIHKVITILDSKIKTPESKWIVGGHSMGSSCVFKYASLYPNRIEKLIFIDGFFFGTGSSVFSFILKYPPLLKWADVILFKHLLNFKTFEELLNSAYSLKPQKTDVEGYLSPFTIENSGSSVFRWTDAGRYLECDFQKINNIKTLIIWGENDNWVPLNNSKMFNEKFNNCKLEIIKTAGHCPMETQPGLVNKLLVGFIKE